MNIVLTTAEIKKIASSKTTVLTIEIPSSVSLDSIQRLAKRDEIFIALGISQTEVSDYLGEPRKGLQYKTDGGGVVESVKPSEEEEADGQMKIDDVKPQDEEAPETADGESEDSEESETESDVEQEEQEETISEEEESEQSDVDDEEVPY